jgi:hypothetical protein
VVSGGIAIIGPEVDEVLDQRGNLFTELFQISKISHK